MSRAAPLMPLNALLTRSTARLRRPAVLLTLPIALLAGCGQAGDLYLPAEPAPPAETAPPAAPEEPATAPGRKKD